MVVDTNFNSHAHVERDQLLKITMLSLSISTHTLTWSVTLRDNELNCLSVISTHTLTWSVTIAEFVVFRIIHISTHTLTWSVTEKLVVESIDIIISTHTLTWSVTMVKRSSARLRSFQLTRSHGA